MLINNYLKSRKYLLLLIIFITIGITLFVKKKQIKISKNTFRSYLEIEIFKNKLLLIEVQKLKFSYGLYYKRFFFIASLNGLKEVFFAYTRVTKNGEIIDIKNIQQLTNTPLSDEELLFSDNDVFIYKSSFNLSETITIIKGKKIIHLVFENKDNKIEYFKASLIVNQHRYLLSNLKTNKQFIVYNEDFENIKKSYFNNLKKLVKEYDWNSKLSYQKFSGISKDKGLPFKYLKIKILEKNFFDIYFFDKKKYIIKVIDSGGVKYSKTGNYLREEDIKDGNIYMDFNIKGGFKIGDKLIRPIIMNYPSLLIDGKNHVNYGFLNKKDKKNDLLLQFGYPLIYKNKKEVEIENLKNNLKNTAKLNKIRTGICIKNDLFGYFYLFGNRSLLIDYLYLVNCDYAFETQTNNIASTKINNSRPKIVFKPKNKVLNKIKFADYKFLKRYNDEILSIYEISCGDLNLSYKIGEADPLVSKIISNKGYGKGVLLFSGSIDPIDPDGLIIKGDVFYKKKEKKAFLISSSECRISLNNSSNNDVFYKEGELIFKNGEKYEVSDKKYEKIMLGLGIRGDMIFIYQFNKPTYYKEIFKYANETKVDSLIIFENYGGILDKEAGKLFINSSKNGREIYEFE